ncbi:MAG TPA: alanine dehydrogenase [Acidimicrobiales bacterium]|nr:alanine dehydrogenase [Acidimicrobiales bacterium]
MRVGIPREVKDNEFRVAMTPAGVRELTSAGHTVLVERGAGVGSTIADDEYVRAGAKIVDSADEVWGGAELVCKVKEPIAEEFHRLRKDLVLFTYLHLAASRECTQAIVGSGVTAIAYETVQLPDRTLPLLAPMSEVAGRMAPLVGSAHLMRPGDGRGVLVSGVPGVHPARVVVIGAGVAGSNAVAVAVGMHAEVAVLDRDLAKLRALDHDYQGRLTTVAATGHTIEEACLGADLVIGAVLIPGAKAPRLVTDDLVERMRPGSVLVDISVDQGGCFESSRPTTHSNPTFTVHRSVFYCVANMPGAVPHTSTHALTNATLPYTFEIARLGWREAVRQDPALALGVNAVGGAVTYAPVAEAHGLPATDLSTALA